MPPERAYQPPFYATRSFTGWWVVNDSNGREIVDFGDGEFFEEHAVIIAEALNEYAEVAQEPPTTPWFRLHLQSREPQCFDSLASVIKYLMHIGPVWYELDQMIGDVWCPLVTRQESRTTNGRPL